MRFAIVPEDVQVEFAIVPEDVQVAFAIVPEDALAFCRRSFERQQQSAGARLIFQQGGPPTKVSGGGPPDPPCSLRALRALRALFSFFFGLGVLFLFLRIVQQLIGNERNITKDFLFSLFFSENWPPRT